MHDPIRVNSVRRTRNNVRFYEKRLDFKKKPDFFLEKEILKNDG